MCICRYVCMYGMHRLRMYTLPPCICICGYAIYVMQHHISCNINESCIRTCKESLCVHADIHAYIQAVYMHTYKQYTCICIHAHLLVACMQRSTKKDNQPPRSNTCVMHSIYTQHTYTHTTHKHRCYAYLRALHLAAATLWP